MEEKITLGLLLTDLLIIGLFLALRKPAQHCNQLKDEIRQCPAGSDLLIKHPQHHHYWIENGMLYESYQTSRGIRFIDLYEMPGEPDNNDYKP